MLCDTRLAACAHTDARAALCSAAHRLQRGQIALHSSSARTCSVTHVKTHPMHALSCRENDYSARTVARAAICCFCVSIRPWESAQDLLSIAVDVILTAELESGVRLSVSSMAMEIHGVFSAQSLGRTCFCCIAHAGRKCNNCAGQQYIEGISAHL